MNAKTYLSLAKELESRKELDQAILSYRQIIQNDDKNFPAFIGLGKVYLEKEQYEESLYYLLRAEVIQPCHEVYLNIGHLFLKKENYKKSLEYYEKSEKLGKPGFDLYFNKAHAYEKQKLRKEAVLSLIKAYSLQPSHIELALKIAPMALEAKLFQEAVEFYKIILKYQEIPLYYAEMGLAYMELGLYEESKKCYQKAKELTLNSKKDLKYKELSYEDFVAKYPDIDRKINEIKADIQNGKINYQQQLDLGNMLFIKGDYQSALNAYIKAREGYLCQMVMKL